MLLEEILAWMDHQLGAAKEDESSLLSASLLRDCLRILDHPRVRYCVEQLETRRARLALEPWDRPPAGPGTRPLTRRSFLVVSDQDRAATPYIGYSEFVGGLRWALLPRISRGSLVGRQRRLLPAGTVLEEETECGSLGVVGSVRIQPSPSIGVMETTAKERT
jgi:hypothetical protein